MKNQNKKPVPPAFSITFTVEQDGRIIQDVIMSEGFESTAAETLFSMSKGLIGQSLLAVLNQKYPELAPLVNAEIEIITQEFLENNGYNAWLNSPAVDCEDVFGGRVQRNQQQGQ